MLKLLEEWPAGTGPQLCQYVLWKLGLPLISQSHIWPLQAVDVVVKGLLPTRGGEAPHPSRRQ